MSIFGGTAFIPDYKTSTENPYLPTIFGTQGMTVTVPTTGTGPFPSGFYQILPGKIIKIHVFYFVVSTTGGISTSTIGFTLPPYPVLDSTFDPLSNRSPDTIYGTASVPSSANAALAFGTVTNSITGLPSPATCVTHPGAGGYFQASGTYVFDGLYRIK